MITDLEYHAHDHEHESFGDLTKKETPGKLSAAAATALKKDKEKVEHALAKAAYNFIDLVKVVGYYVIGCLVLYYHPKERMGLRIDLFPHRDTNDDRLRRRRARVRRRQDLHDVLDRRGASGGLSRHHQGGGPCGEEDGIG